jgi:hypothetical protein
VLAAVVSRAVLFSASPMRMVDATTLRNLYAGQPS